MKIFFCKLIVQSVILRNMKLFLDFIVKYTRIFNNRRNETHNSE